MLDSLTNGGLETFNLVSDLFKNGAGKMMSVGGDAMGFVGGAASKVGGAVATTVANTTSVVAEKVVEAKTSVVERVNTKLNDEEDDVLVQLNSEEKRKSGQDIASEEFDFSDN